MIKEKINNKIALIFLFLFLSCGIIFANDPNEQIELPQNTVSVDVGSTLYFLSFAGIMNLMDYPTFAFGIGAQYERKITDKVSAAGLLGYGVLDISNENYKWNMSYFSADVHARYYPGQSAFFFGGMIGYANIFADISEKETTAHYFRFGGKLGWSIDFGLPGGFVFEPAIAYYGAIGSSLDFDYDEDIPFLKMLTFLNNSIARTLFVDSLRFSLNLGYRF